MVDVLFLCTGNAARSVMATVSLTARRSDLEVRSGGTLVVDGQPMSIRTRAAIEALGHPVPRHASRQVYPPDLDDARLIVALAPEHVDWVRRTHRPSAHHTITLKRLVRDIDHGLDVLDEQVRALAPASIELENWEEVIDPGGSEADVFAACAREIDDLVHQLAPRLGR